MSADYPDYNSFIAHLIREASAIGKMVGARLLVKDVEPVDEVTAWANRTKLHAVVYEKNKPSPTEGIVLMVGSDPLVQEEVKVGDHVFFSKFAGHETYEEGVQYRSLEIQEVTRVKSRVFYGWKEEDGQDHPPGA